MGYFDDEAPAPPRGALSARLEQRRQSDRRFARTVLLFVGLLAGVGLGLYVGWVAWPIQFTEADPSLLDERYGEDYTRMIAAAYAQDGDLAAARRRLASLNRPDIDAWLLSLTVDAILEGEPVTEIRPLVRLASDLGLASPIMAPFLESP